MPLPSGSLSVSLSPLTTSTVRPTTQALIAEGVSQTLAAREQLWASYGPARLEEMRNFVAATAAQGAYEEVPRCPGAGPYYGIITADLPCSPATLTQFEFLEGIWNEATNQLNRLVAVYPDLEQRVNLLLEKKRAGILDVGLRNETASRAAWWCRAVTTWSAVKLWATNINPRYWVPPGFAYTAATIPPDESSGGRKPDGSCYLPFESRAGWSPYCFPGERWRGDKVESQQALGPAAGGVLAAVGAGSELQGHFAQAGSVAQAQRRGSKPVRVYASFILPHVDPRSCDPVFNAWNAPLRQYPKTLVDVLGKDNLDRMSQVDVFNTWFAREIDNVSDYQETRNGDADGHDRTFGPTPRKQLQFCAALARDLARHPRGFYEFVADSFSYCVHNTIPFWAAIGMADLTPVQVAELQRLARQNRIAAGTGGIRQISSTLSQAQAALGVIVGVALFVVMPLFKWWIGKIIPTGGPGCMESIVLRTTRDPACTLAGTPGDVCRSLQARGVPIPGSCPPPPGGAAAPGAGSDPCARPGYEWLCEDPDKLSTPVVIAGLAAVGLLIAVLAK